MTLLLVWLIVSIACTAFVLVCLGFAPVIEEHPVSVDRVYPSHSAFDEGSLEEDTPSEETASFEESPIVAPKPNFGGFADLRSQEPRS